MAKKITYDQIHLVECSWDAFKALVENTIKDLKTLYPDAHDFSIEIEKSLGYYDSIEAVIILTYKRLETDEEYNARLEDEQGFAERRKAYEKAEFERLKKKFGEALKDNDL
jgi:hypothetical protein